MVMALGCGKGVDYDAWSEARSEIWGYSTLNYCNKASKKRSPKLCLDSFLFYVFFISYSEEIHVLGRLWKHSIHVWGCFVLCPRFLTECSDDEKFSLSIIIYGPAGETQKTPTSKVVVISSQRREVLRSILSCSERRDRTLGLNIVIKLAGWVSVDVISWKSINTSGAWAGYFSDEVRQRTGRRGRRLQFCFIRNIPERYWRKASFVWMPEVVFLFFWAITLKARYVL